MVTPPELWSCEGGEVDRWRDREVAVENVRVSVEHKEARRDVVDVRGLVGKGDFVDPLLINPVLLIVLGSLVETFSVSGCVAEKVGGKRKEKREDDDGKNSKSSSERDKEIERQKERQKEREKRLLSLTLPLRVRTITFSICTV